MWQPQNNILKAIAKLNISSSDKEEVIDAVITLYNDRVRSYFTEIVSLSLEYGTDVQIPLLLKYGDIYEFVDGVSIISYLWKLKRFDLLDSLIEKYPSDINSIIYTLRYEDLENDEVISYLKSKATKPKRIDSKFEITEIHLLGENVTSYNLEVANLSR